CALEVAREDIAGEAVERVVGDPHGLGLVLVWKDRQDRSEDLLARDGHVVAYLAEHRRLHVVPAGESLGSSRAADGELLALVDPRLDQTLDLVDLRLAHHGTEHGAVAEWIADSHRLRRGLRDLDGRVVLSSRDEHAAGRVAGLPTVQEAGADAAADRRL